MHLSFIILSVFYFPTTIMGLHKFSNTVTMLVFNSIVKYSVFGFGLFKKVEMCLSATRPLIRHCW